MRTLTLCLALLLWLPAAAWGANEDCTLGDNESLTWGPIGTISSNGGDCEEAARVPDGDDHIIIPDGSTVTADNASYAYTAADSSLEVQSGGSLSADASAVEDAIVFHFYDGQDGVSVGGTSYDTVAAYFEAGSSVDLQCGYLTWGLATAAYETEVTETNDTMWTVDLFAPCGDASADPDAFLIGGNQDCTTGDQEYGFSLVWTAARNDPEAGCGAGCGDNYIDDTLTHLATKNYDHYIVTFITGMEAGHSYTIQDGDIDAAGNEMSMALYVPQMEQGGALTQAQYPIASRAQQLLGVTVAAAAGDTCIETAAGLLSADGDYISTCAYFYDAAGDNAFANSPPGPYKVMRTEDDEKCDGTTGGGEESYHLALDAALPEALVVGDQMVLSPLCAGQGDKFSVKAPVWFEMEETAGWALGNSKVICDDCYFRARGLVISGSGLVLCEGSGCDWNTDDIQFWGCGDNDGPVLKFENTTNAIMSCAEIVGGSQTEESNGILFEGVTDLTKMTDMATRYIAGPTFYTADSTMGTAIFERTSCEREAHVAAANGDDCISVADDWNVVTITDLFAGDWGQGGGASIVDTSGTPVTVNGLAIAGQIDGGITGKTAVGMRVAGVLARGIDTSLSALGGGWLGYSLLHSDIRDITLDTGTSYSLLSELAAGVTQDVEFTDNYFEDLSVDNYYVLAADEDFRNSNISRNIFRNATSVHANCDNNSACSVIYIVTDDDTGNAGHVIEQNQMMWDEGETTEFLSAFASDASSGDVITFGGNAIINLVNALANVDVIGINIDADIASNSTQRSLGSNKVLNNCVSYVEATDGTSTTEYAANADSYPTIPLLGMAPEFDANGVTLRRNSLMEQKKCAAPVGTRRPGMPVGHSWLYMKMGIPEPERKPLVKKGELGGP